jgi:hypothetical protein
MLLLIESFKLCAYLFHFRRENTYLLLLVRPVTVRQSFHSERHSGLVDWHWQLWLDEFIICIFWELDVIEHRLELIDGVVTALDSKFLQE